MIPEGVCRRSRTPAIRSEPPQRQHHTATWSKPPLRLVSKCLQVYLSKTRLQSHRTCLYRAISVSRVNGREISPTSGGSGGLCPLRRMGTHARSEAPTWLRSAGSRVKHGMPFIDIRPNNGSGRVTDVKELYGIWRPDCRRLLRPIRRLAEHLCAARAGGVLALG